MLDLFSTWQFNLIGYLIFIVSFYQFYKLAVKNVTKDAAATVLMQLIGGITILFLIPFHSLILPNASHIYLILIASCIFYAISDIYDTKARKHLEVSVMSIMSQLTTVFLISIGFTAFGESFEMKKALGALLILCGNVLLFYKKGSLTLNKYTTIALISIVTVAIAISIDIGISDQFNLPIYIAITYFLPAVITVFAKRISRSDITKEFNSPARKYFLITGISWAAAIYFSLRAFQFGEVTTIVPLQGTSVFLNVVIAYFFLHERENISKKLIAAILVILGIILTVGNQ